MEKQNIQALTKTTGSKVGWGILILCFCATTAIYIPYYGHSTQTATLMDQLGLNYTQVGMLDSVAALSAGIVMLFSGMITYKWGARNISILGMSVALAGELLLAFAPGYSMLILARIIQGIGIALIFVGPYAMVLRWYARTEHLGLALGVMVACDGAGALLALYAFAFVLALTGWVFGTVIGAALLGVMLLLTILFMKEPDSWYEEKERQKEERIPLKQQIKEIYLNRNVFAACMFIIPVWGMYATAAYWVPLVLTENAGWSETSSGLVSSFFSCAGMLAFIFGILSDKIGKRKPLTLISGIGAAISFAILTIAFVQENYTLVAIMLVSSGFFAYCGLLLVYYLVSDDVGSIKSGAANGLIMGVGYLVGGFVYPLVVGYFKDLTGDYATGFVAITVTVVIFGVLGLIPSKDTPKELRKE